MDSYLSIKRIVAENQFAQNSYLCFNDNVMFLVDCGCSKESFLLALKEIDAENRKLDCILLTHCHFDHILGLYDIWDKYKCDIYLANKCEDFLYDKMKNLSSIFGEFNLGHIYPERLKGLSDKDAVAVGDLKITAYSTSGHSICSMCYSVGEYLFTGDTILQGTVGRVDLYGGSMKNLIDSLLKIQKIPFKLALPGHGDKMDSELVNGIINFYVN